MARRLIDRLVAAVLAAGILLGLAGAAHAQAGVFEPLGLETASGRHDFQVEVMRTPSEHARGMMFRRELATDRGMLFVFQDVTERSFWMENTYVPLDLIFILPDGTVHRVANDAEPLSRTPISSGAPVAAVLEVIAGTAKRLGLRPGDRVVHAFFR